MIDLPNGRKLILPLDMEVTNHMKRLEHLDESLNVMQNGLDLENKYKMQWIMVNHARQELRELIFYLEEVKKLEKLNQKEANEN